MKQQMDQAETKWVCSGNIGKYYCGHLNPDSADTCFNCESKKAMVGIPFEQAAKGIKKPKTPVLVGINNLRQTPITIEKRYGPAIGSGKVKRLAIGSLVFALLATACWWLFFKTTPATLKVLNVIWERKVDVEELHIRSGDGWSTPISAFNIHSEQRKHGTTQVPDGTEQYSIPQTDTSVPYTYTCGKPMGKEQ